MIESLKNHMDSICSVLLVANTPAYLYDHLRRVLSNVDVPFEKISEELDRQFAHGDPLGDFDSLAYTYALIALMTYDESSKAREKLRSVSTIGGIRWVKELVHYYEQRSAFTNNSRSIDVHVEPTDHPTRRVESVSSGLDPVRIRKDGNTSIHRF